MEIKISQQASESVMTLSGRFDYNALREFSRSLDSMLDSTTGGIVIDFTDVSHLDSSALGILLQAREKLQTQGSPALVLANPSPTVRRVFEIANFQKKFTLRG